MVLSGPPTLSPRQPTLWMQALGPRSLHGFGEEGGGPISRTSSWLQAAAVSPESHWEYTTRSTWGPGINIQGGRGKQAQAMGGTVAITDEGWYRFLWQRPDVTEL